MNKQLFPITTGACVAKDHFWEVHTHQNLSPEMFIRLLWANGLRELSTSYHIESNNKSIARVDLINSKDIVSLIFDLDASIIGYDTSGYKIESSDSDTNSWGNKYSISINTLNALGQKNRIYDFALVQLVYTRFPADYFSEKGIEVNESLLANIHNNNRKKRIDESFNAVNNFLVYYVSRLNETSSI